MFARDYRRLARFSLEGNWGPSIVAGLIASLLGGLVTGTRAISLDLDADTLRYIQFNLPSLFAVLKGILIGILGINLVRLFVGCAVRLGYCTYLLKQHDRQERSYKDLFTHFNNYGSAFYLALTEGVLIFLWSLLFVIPGIIASYRYAMAPFILAENPELSADQAIKLSKEMMKGNKWRLCCLELSFIGWNILSALTLGIGDLFLVPYTSAARAAFYRSLCDENKINAEEI